MSRLVALVVALVALLQPTTATAAAEPPIGRWETPVVRVHIDDTMRRHGYKAKTVIRAWRATGAVDVRVVSDPCDGCVSASAVRPYDVELDLPHGWDGLTYPYVVEGVFTRCDIHMNAEQRWRERAGSFAHELGHCLGLGHGHNERSVMSVGRIDSAVHPLPTELDAERLRALYGATS